MHHVKRLLYNASYRMLRLSKLIGCYTKFIFENPDKVRHIRKPAFRNNFINSFKGTLQEVPAIFEPFLHEPFTRSYPINRKKITFESREASRTDTCELIKRKVFVKILFHYFFDTKRAVGAQVVEVINKRHILVTGKKNEEDLFQLCF